MAVEIPVSEQNNAARAVIELAGAALAERRNDIPAGFVAQLFGRAVPEDVLCYAPADLADLAERAFDFLKDRRPGAPKIRCETVALKKSDARKSVSVIEIANDDMPFLVDSVMGEIGERRLNVQLVAHPIFGVRRDGAKLLTLGAPDAAGGARESFIYIHLEPIADAAVCAVIVRALDGVLGEVRLAVTDWRAMLDRVNGMVAELKTNPPPLPVDEIAEAIQFLQWLLADNFTFIGVRDYVLAGNDLQPDMESALGIMRSPDLQVLRRGRDLLEITPEIMAFLKEPCPLIVAKANIHSLVHRRVYLDYIGVKRFDKSGNLAGEFRIVGLFTSTAYTRSAHGIPYLRRKIAGVERRAGFDPGSHFSKALTNVLEHYPRDELFQIDEETLYHFAMAILQLDERPRVRVLARHDRFDRFVSVLVFVPRERYSSTIRGKIGDYLSGVFLGHVSAFYPFFPEGPLVRVHYIIGRSGGELPAINGAMLEREVAAIVRSWTDGLSEALALVVPPDKVHELFNRYRDAFSQGFHEFYPPAVAANDIRTIELLSEARPLAVELRHRNEKEQQNVSLKVWSLGRPLPLSERVPVLENMGFTVVDERTYRITPQGDARFWLHDMLLERRDGGMIDLEVGKVRLEAAFLMVMRGVAENDGYNALTLAGNLAWRDVALIRTLSRFLRQVRVPFSQDYMWATLTKHAAIAGHIVELFYARFDPRPDAAHNRDARQKEIEARIEEELQKVDSLDEDRILRRFVNAVQSAIRTNFFQIDKDGHLKPLIAVKFASGKIDRPAVAAAALRDLRLFAARRRRASALRQGGARRHPLVRPAAGFPHRGARPGEGAAGEERGDRAGRRQGRLRAEAAAAAPRARRSQAEGIATYKLFISTLLDITDNIDRDGAIVPPADVVRHDGDDPYLVVAADKGTATFSDIANGISLEHDYWLGDAFASGGSAGYDHKAMGITARGAWEAVKRHFREMDVDISTTPFTVGRRRRHVGRRVRQRHAARAHDQAGGGVRPPRHLHRSRSRSGAKPSTSASGCSTLPRSSWQDYDKTLISKGGGVYPRASKEIRRQQGGAEAARRRRTA